MYGPSFLVFYAGFIIFMILLLLIVKKMIDRSNNRPIPQISNNVDPFEISYLRGKEEELARSVVFSLIKKDFLEFSETKTSVKRKESKVRTDNLSKIESIALNWFGKERSTSEIFQSTGLILQLTSYGMNYKQKLENEQLLIDSETQKNYALIKWSALAAIFGLGVYKVLVAISKGNFNIMFLVIMAFIGFTIIKRVSTMPRISRLGQDYLNRLQLTFDSLKNNTLDQFSTRNKDLPTQQTTFAGIDPMLLSVGVFGGAILAGTVYDNYNQVFAKSLNSTNAYSSGCGIGCGDCSSGSSWGSGSSCSSCSSCGGGCGGCGGCS